jgi:eukaryotic-like serine/threonine-protein kinase
MGSGERGGGPDRRAPASGDTPPSAAPTDFLAVPAALFAAPIIADVAERDAAEEGAVRALLVRGLAARYAVEGLLGSGGMAFVYLATDLRLARRVAIKAMRPAIARDIGADRFAREIAVAARLQHPHVVTLHDSGEVEGLPFYVMPYVAGESLRARLARERQLPVSTAVGIACEVADALAYAHRHDVIHRDVKPENILLEGGHALVADFGVARAISRVTGDTRTGTGIAIGTPAYMSPEQRRGARELDARADIYAIGCVLHEMLVGEPSPEQPGSVRVVRPTVPAHVDAALRKALAPLPADRFEDAAQFAVALRGADAASDAVDAVPDPRAGIARRRRRDVLVAAIAVTAGVAATALVVGTPTAGRDRDVVPRPMRFGLVPPGGRLHVRATGPATIALDPDGAQLALVRRRGGSTDVVLRDMGTGTFHDVAGTSGAEWIEFSPDGAFLLFVARGRLWRVPAEGGAPVTVTADGASAASWSREDEVIIERLRRLYRIPANGGPREAIELVPDGHVGYGVSRPSVLPGGEALVVTVFEGTLGARDPHAELAILRIADGRLTRLGIAGHHGRYAAPGLLVFGRGSSLYAAPFSLERFALAGPATRVLADVDAKDVTIAQDGTMAYVQVRDGGERRLMRVEPDGRSTALGSAVAAFTNLRVSPDGKRVALQVQGGGIWIYDMASSTLSRLTELASASRPEWTPDGRSVAYVARPDSNGRRVVLQQPWDGSEPPRLLMASPRPVWEIAFSPTGRHFVVQLDTADATGEDLYLASLDSPTVLRSVGATSAQEYSPRVSPDGRLLAYVGAEGGRIQVFVRVLSGPVQRIQVSTDGGTHPVWSRDGRTLYYRSAGEIVAARVELEPELAVLRRDVAFADTYLHPDFARAAYDVLPGGREFVMLDVADSTRPDSLFVVVNWAAEVYRRLRMRDR